MIREYQDSDKNAVLNLLRLNTPKYFAPEEEKDLDDYLDNERELYFVIIFDNKLVGCGGINFADNNTRGKISWDILHPDYQGKSIGTQLLKHRIEILKPMENIQKISVRTSQITYKFYENNGFELFEIIKDYWAKGFDLYNMEFKKELDK